MRHNKYIRLTDLNSSDVVDLTEGTIVYYVGSDEDIDHGTMFILSENAFDDEGELNILVHAHTEGNDDSTEFDVDELAIKAWSGYSTPKNITVPMKMFGAK
jgi:hypothetical protein